MVGNDCVPVHQSKMQSKSQSSVKSMSSVQNPESRYCTTTLCICHMGLDARLPLFLVYIENIRDPGDKTNQITAATTVVGYSKSCMQQGGAAQNDWGEGVGVGCSLRSPSRFATDLAILDTERSVVSICANVCFRRSFLWCTLEALLALHRVVVALRRYLLVGKLLSL